MGLFCMLLAFGMCERRTRSLVRPSSSKSFILVAYLVLVDGGCPNSLLPVDSIPSTSDHLFWNRSLESIECLENTLIPLSH